MADQGILDGAIFAFGDANDPDLLLTVTARRESDPGGTSWAYSLARMCSMKLVMRLDDAEIHTFENYRDKPRSRQDPYIEAREGRFAMPADAAPSPRDPD